MAGRRVVGRGLENDREEDEEGVEAGRDKEAASV